MSQSLITAERLSGLSLRGAVLLCLRTWARSFGPADNPEPVMLARIFIHSYGSGRATRDESVPDANVLARIYDCFATAIGHALANDRDNALVCIKLGMEPLHSEPPATEWKDGDPILPLVDEGNVDESLLNRVIDDFMSIAQCEESHQAVVHMSTTYMPRLGKVVHPERVHDDSVTAKLWDTLGPPLVVDAKSSMPPEGHFGVSSADEEPAEDILVAPEAAGNVVESSQPTVVVGVSGELPNPDLLRPLKVYIEPGGASSELIAKFYADLSNVYRAYGGSGLKIVKDEIGSLVGEEV